MTGVGGAPGRQRFGALALAAVSKSEPARAMTRMGVAAVIERIAASLG